MDNKLGKIQVSSQTGRQLHWLHYLHRHCGVPSHPHPKVTHTQVEKRHTLYFSSGAGKGQSVSEDSWTVHFNDQGCTPRQTIIAKCIQRLSGVESTVSKWPGMVGSCHRPVKWPHSIAQSGGYPSPYRCERIWMGSIPRGKRGIRLMDKSYDTKLNKLQGVDGCYVRHQIFQTFIKKQECANTVAYLTIISQQ